MMEKLISAFPENISEAIEIANASHYRKPSNPIQNIVICGMGGSGIGGGLVQNWVEEELSVPVITVKDYTLPEFVSNNSLVIGSSYSGNTEETTSSVKEAISRGAHIIGICSGGALKTICEENDFDVVIVPGGNPPRTALAFSIIQLLNILTQLELIKPGRLNELEKSRELIIEKEQEIKQTAREVAEFLKGKVGILYGTSKYEPILVRARQQFNENGKFLCWHHPLPEMNHNELVGWGGGDDRFAVVFFMPEDMHPRNAKRIEITKEVISKKTSNVFEIHAKGSTVIERSIYMINIVDWASLYLSEIKNVDPVDIEVIDFLKGELANFK